MFSASPAHFNVSFNVLVFKFFSYLILGLEGNIDTARYRNIWVETFYGLKRHKYLDCLTYVLHSGYWNKTSNRLTEISVQAEFHSVPSNHVYGNSYIV